MNLAAKPSNVLPSVALRSPPPSTTRDRESFAEQLASMRPLLRRRALMLTQCPAAADDLVQEAIERALVQRGLFRPGSNLGAWLTSVMRNLFIDECRRVTIRSRARRELVQDPPPPEESSFGPVDVLRDADLRAALGELRAPDRQLLELVYFKGVSYRDISRRFSLTVSTTGTRIHRAKAKLRTILARVYQRRLAEGAPASAPP